MEYLEQQMAELVISAREEDEVELDDPAETEDAEDAEDEQQQEVPEEEVSTLIARYEDAKREWAKGSPIRGKSVRYDAPTWMKKKAVQKYASEGFERVQRYCFVASRGRCFLRSREQIDRWAALATSECKGRKRSRGGGRPLVPERQELCEKVLAWFNAEKLEGHAVRKSQLILQFKSGMEDVPKHFVERFCEWIIDSYIPLLVDRARSLIGDPKMLIVMDAARPHISQDVLRECKLRGIETAVILCSQHSTPSATQIQLEK